jgi:nucleoside-diphosphate-sugar epimerase/glycosyltransferase involved in cell wall biosynthesis
MLETSSYIRSLKGPILITGASGFIGANLFKKIAAVRNDVYAVVQSQKGWRLSDTSDDVVIAVDINDYASTKNMIDKVLPQTLFDCVAYGAYSFEEDNSLIYQTNFLSIVNLVRLLSAYPFTAYIHAGSSSEYGTNCSAPSESSVCQPNSPYAVSKVAINTYLRFMGRHHGFPCINLRLYSVYGPLEDTSRLFPNLIRQALSGRLPPFVDPLTSRDFIYVDDVCDAFILAAAKINPNLYGESFNIGTGIQTTIAELADVAKRVFNIEELPQFGKMQGRAWDLKNWYANPNKAAELLDWRPTVKVEDGLRKMAVWTAKLTETEVILGSKKNITKRKHSLTAIIACYKDGEAIPIMHRRLSDVFRKLDIDYEIIFVNDCSPDESAKIIREISASDARVIGISHSRNFGSQMAFRSGMEIATKDGVVLLDGDLQDPPELIELFYAKWLEGYDVIYGRRIKRDMPWYWNLMYKLFYRVFAMFSYVSIPLDAGDFSLMDRRVVGWLLNCPERDLFVRGLRAYVGFKQAGVDYVRPERMFGRSTNSLIKNIDWAKKGIFSFSNTPLTILTTAGVILFAFSILIAVIVGLLRLFIPDVAPRGITTVLITTLIFGSFNLFAIGLVGEYVAKIMAEVKGRPRFIRASMLRNGQIIELLPDGKINKGQNL